jgi:hypothetical protein
MKDRHEKATKEPGEDMNRHEEKTMKRVKVIAVKNKGQHKEFGKEGFGGLGRCDSQPPWQLQVPTAAWQERVGRQGTSSRSC